DFGVEGPGQPVGVWQPVKLIFLQPPRDGGEGSQLRRHQGPFWRFIRVRVKHGPMITQLISFAIFFLATSCASRFTNEHVVKPEGIQTIAVEAVFDTSREVLPHEAFWGSLQTAFAANGHLQVVPQSDADALVRAHVKSAAIRHIGSPSVQKPEDDPEVYDG